MLRRNVFGLSMVLGCWALLGPAVLQAQDGAFGPPMPSQAAAAPSGDMLPAMGGGAPGWGNPQGEMGGPGGPYYQGAYGGAGGYAGPGGYGGFSGECATCGPAPCGEPCCDTCGDCCDFYMAPVCVINEGFVWMQRASPNEGIIVRSGVNSVVNAAQLEFEYQPGFDISVLKEDEYGLGTEVRALWLDEYTDDVQIRDFSGPNLFINTFLVKSPGTGSLTPLNPPAFELPQDFSMTYKSETGGVELNYHEPWSPNLRMFMGVRYARLEEELFLATRDADEISTLSYWWADNDLIGFQVGGHYIIWHDYRCRLEAVGRGGIFLNVADVEVAFDGPGNVNGRGEDSNSEDAMIGEFKLQMTWQICPTMAVTTGYQMLGYDGVVLASEQVSTTGRLNGVENIVIRQNVGSVLYHGGFIGLEIRK